MGPGTRHLGTVTHAVPLWEDPLSPIVGDERSCFRACKEDYSLAKAMPHTLHHSIEKLC